MTMTEVQNLKNTVEKLHLNSPEVIVGLSSRKKKEVEFHDFTRNYESHSKLSEQKKRELFGNLKYYSIASRSRNYVDEYLMKFASGKIVLDLACGDGDMSLKISDYGASLCIGVDISPISIKNAKSTQEKFNKDNLIFYVGDAENTRLPDNSIDLILCSGMLHHLDLSYVFPEVRRILKPGGRLLALEALDVNPAIRMYRKFTPSQRTEFESKHIIKLNDINFGQRFFNLGEVKYWHVIGYIGAKVKFLKKPLDSIDKVIEKIPLVQKLAWQITFEFIKPETD